MPRLLHLCPHRPKGLNDDHRAEAIRRMAEEEGGEEEEE